MLEAFVRSHLEDLKSVATAVRSLGMDAVLAAKSGHVGLPLGGAEMATLLYFAAMRVCGTAPQWVCRDRFVLSAGHGSMLQYASLHLAGFDISLDEIKNFRKLGSKTPGHPEFRHTPGVECTTGPLGQGISNAVGMAIAERMVAERFNSKEDSFFGNNTYVILGDGCMMEGVSSEACSLAGHLKLSRLVALYDANNITIDGTIDIAFSEDVGKRFEAYGWNVLHADGNDFLSLAKALDAAQLNVEGKQGTGGPTLVVAKGIPGKGSPKWEGKPKIHGNPMTADDVLDAKKHLGLDNFEPFFVSESARKSADKLNILRNKQYEQWLHQFSQLSEKWKKSDTKKWDLWNAHFGNETQVTLSESDWNSAKGKTSTRVASGKALTALSKLTPTLIGGSADLAGSNNTTLPETTFLNRESFAGRNIHFGVREHAMGAITNGIALYGGFKPYCATFAVFSDYMRPTLRLAALMNIPSVFIFTHDSYAVGEDGPTHQPIEHAASLRAIPNLKVLRPADGMETFAAWQYAINQPGPVALLLTRQDVPDLDDIKSATTKRTQTSVMVGMKEGAYLLKDFRQDSSVQVTLVASGSEVSVALNAAHLLEGTPASNLNGEKINLGVRVVSCPAPQELVSHPLLLNKLVPDNVVTVAIEAGVSQSWGEIVGRNGAVFSMSQFGFSAPYDVLANYLGFVPDKFAQFVLNTLKLRS